MSGAKNQAVTVTSIISNSGRAHPYLKKWINRSGQVVGRSKSNMLLVHFKNKKGTSIFRSIPDGCVTPSSDLAYIGQPREKSTTPAPQPITKGDIVAHLKDLEAEFDEMLQSMDYPLDEDGYPTRQALDLIEKWPTWRSSEVPRLFDFVESIWHLKSWGWHCQDAIDDVHEEHVIEYNISTAGWSGNESIITAMRSNFPLWATTWVSSHRGGHYVFYVKKENQPEMKMELKL